MSIRPKPFWLRWMTEPYQWVTVHPYIYAPSAFFEDKASPRWTPILNHEGIHLARQIDAGPLKWLCKYALSRSFRLSEEAIAIAIEIKTDLPERRGWLIENYSKMLAGKPYLWAARSQAEARLAIESRL